MKPISSYFGELTLSTSQICDLLPKEHNHSLTRSLTSGKAIKRETANTIASTIQSWAMKHGATHFCHWFQPMNGSTAEKHDAFIDVSHPHSSELRVIERFSGSQLIQGEPDASSFPSGGMRTTFEARGYTAWDPQVPIFVVDHGNSKTLCIPSVFVDYHGQALDTKTPLVRSCDNLSKAACGFLKLIGDVDVKRVESTVGAEQEFFIVDKSVAAARPDLTLTGRLLFGAPSSRGQKMEDHYFGSIPSRVLSFMEELEVELYRLGIPVKTRHNEVAPSQFEMAPIYETASIAADHNALAMETMKRIASKHDLVCLFHEKPFPGLNGSGKHCNWSLINDKGENLLDPGKTPHQNLRFLTLTTIVIAAIRRQAAVMISSVTSNGNDLRLGANEAPPAVLSIFLGSMLTNVFDSIVANETIEPTDDQFIKLGVGNIPDVSKDYTDRNRTSPFAFTGNKFEFRAVGSSANIAIPIAILNSAVIESFKEATKQLQDHLNKGLSKDQACLELIKTTYKENNIIVYNGNNYGDEWKEEAKKRGLPIITDVVDSLQILEKPEHTEFLVSAGTFSSDELTSRLNVKREQFCKSHLIEIDVMIEMLNCTVIPSIEKQLHSTQQVALGLGTRAGKAAFDKRLSKLESTAGRLIEGSFQLSEYRAEILDESSPETIRRAAQICKDVADLASEAELLTSEDCWQLPKCRDLLFHPTLRW